MLPILRTKRLLLSPFGLDDAPIVQRLAGDYEVARTTLNIPHPYPDGVAEKWIAGHLLAFLEGRDLVLAIRHGGALIGAISLMLHKGNRNGELGYWIGKEFWGKGYCTEAAEELIRFGFESLKLERVFARHMATNPASGRVMQKLGMKQEGVLRKHVMKEGTLVDVVIYGIVREEAEISHSLAG